MMNNCGTCAYHTFSDGLWVCNNELADAYGLDTAWDNACEDYET
jgi:hypothetical protein